jgi:ectoine hydroxylase-related dioxygenase (phytanoyl-CoA dioxygenase family)
MTPEEKFRFDLQGYLVVKHVLNAAELAALNVIAERESPTRSGELTYGRVFRASAWGPPYQALIDHPRIVPYLLELVGPRFRLDHDYCIFTTKGGTGQELHGGEGDANPDHWYRYRDGVMRNGLTVVTYCLTRANGGDGGFCCIPGSHKSHFVRNLAADVREYRRRPDYVVQPPLEAGDVVIFTEALVHGTAPWMADHERRALLYKYSPGHSAWMGEYYDAREYGALTEQQKRILAPPSVGGRPRTIAPR